MKRVQIKQLIFLCYLKIIFVNPDLGINYLSLSILGKIQNGNGRFTVLSQIIGKYFI